MSSNLQFAFCNPQGLAWVVYGLAGVGAAGLAWLAARAVRRWLLGRD